MLRTSLLVVLALASCGPAPPGSPAPAPARAPAPIASTAPPPAPPAAPAAPRPARLEFSKDDLPGAMARAKREGKAVFVDAWAPWCHTCLSMKHYVFVDPSLSPLAERLVFVALDTDRPINEAFVDKYAIDVWPTFFVLDPESGDVLGYWPGAASARELRELATDALDVFDARRKSDPSLDPLLAGLVQARAAHAERRYADAASAYAKLVQRAPADWPRRSEALLGWIASLGESGQLEQCARAGLEHLADVRGAAIPADFARSVFACSAGIRDARRRRAARERAIARLREIVAAPSPEASIDDRADALHILADALEELEDRAGARALHEQRLALLEDAARRAPTPQAAATYDYGRATAYLELGRPEQAVAMLEERERQLPDSYEPPARLASVLAEMRRHADALAAVDRALKHAYGPRRLRYLALKARVQQQLNDRKGAVATLEEEVRGHEALGKRASRQRLEDAKQRLRAARRGLGK